MNNTFIGTAAEYIKGKGVGRVKVDYLGKETEVNALNFFNSPVLTGREVIVVNSNQINGFLIVAVNN